MNGAEIDLGSLQLEERNALLSELMVTGEPALSELAVGDCIVQRNLGDRRKHGRRANTVACCIEERGYRTDSLWCVSRGCGCACVVLDATADSDVGELETGTDSWKT